MCDSLAPLHKASIGSLNWTTQMDMKIMQPSFQYRLRFIKFLTYLLPCSSCTVAAVLLSLHIPQCMIYTLFLTSHSLGTFLWFFCRCGPEIRCTTENISHTFGRLLSRYDRLLLAMDCWNTPHGCKNGNGPQIDAIIFLHYIFVNTEHILIWITL